MVEHNQRSIYLIDNDPSMPIILSKAIESLGVHPDDITVISKKSHLEEVTSAGEKPQLAIIDLDFSEEGTTGLELLQQLGQMSENKLPIIAITSNSSDNFLQTAVNLGANIVIPKVFELDTFKTVVALYLGIQT